MLWIYFKSFLWFLSHGEVLQSTHDINLIERVSCCVSFPSSLKYLLERNFAHKSTEYLLDSEQTWKWQSDYFFWPRRGERVKSGPGLLGRARQLSITSLLLGCRSTGRTACKYIRPTVLSLGTGGALSSWLSLWDIQTLTDIVTQSPHQGRDQDIRMTRRWSTVVNSVATTRSVCRRRI